MTQFNNFLDVRDAALNLAAVVPVSVNGVPGVAKAADGTVWIASGGALMPFSAGVLGAPIVMAGVNFVAAASSSGIWTLEGTQLVLRDLQGAVLASWSHGLSGNPAFLVPDTLGGVWIVDGSIVNAAGQITPGQVAHVDGGGMSNTPWTPSTQVVDMVTDRLGRAWVLSADSTVQVLDASQGSVAVMIPQGTARSLMVDPIGRPRWLVTQASGTNLMQTLGFNGPTSTLVLPLSPSSFQGRWEGARVDQLGQTWLWDANLSLLVLDRDGQPASSLPAVNPISVGSFSFVGDQTAGALTGILLPFLDSDGDGFPNELEIRAGSNALDGASLPPLILSSGLAAGQQGTLSIVAPADGGAAFLVGASGGASGFVSSLINPLTVGLDLDPLFSFWFSAANILVSPAISGTLDAAGGASLNLALPAGATGISFFVAAAMLDLSPLRLRSITPPLNLLVP